MFRLEFTIQRLSKYNGKFYVSMNIKFTPFLAFQHFVRHVNIEGYYVAQVKLNTSTYHNQNFFGNTNET